MATVTVAAGAPGDLPGTDPFAALVAALVLAMVLALATVLRVLEPETLAYVRRKVGVGPLLGGALAVVLAVSLASVFALGGGLAGRSDPLFLATLVVHLLGLWLLGLGAGSVPDYARVRRASRRDAHAVEAGDRVAVAGTAVVADGTVETPFAGTEVLCYEARVVEYRRDDPGESETQPAGLGSGWVPEELHDERVRFAVDDDTGRVLVDPGDGALQLDEAVTPVADDDPDDRRYVEATLRPGEPVTVVGTATRDEATGHARVDASVVADHDPATLERDLRRRSLRTGGEGLALWLGGYAGMLVVTGAL